MHDLWHVAVLGSTLFGAAGAILLALSPLLFERTPPGLARRRPLILALLGGAGVLIALEWTVVH